MSYEGLQKPMPLDLFADTLKFVNVELALPINPRTLEIILSSNGYAYASIIEFGLNDTETRGAISDAVSNHYLNRPWPKLSDKDVSMDDWYQRILTEISRVDG